MITDIDGDLHAEREEQRTNLIKKVMDRRANKEDKYTFLARSISPNELLVDDKKKYHRLYGAYPLSWYTSNLISDVENVFGFNSSYFKHIFIHISRYERRLILFVDQGYLRFSCTITLELFSRYNRWCREPASIGAGMSELEFRPSSTCLIMCSKAGDDTFSVKYDEVELDTDKFEGNEMDLFLRCNSYNFQLAREARAQRFQHTFSNSIKLPELDMEDRRKMKRNEELDRIERYHAVVERHMRDMHDNENDYDLLAATLKEINSTEYPYFLYPLCTETSNLMQELVDAFQIPISSFRYKATHISPLMVNLILFIEQGEKTFSYVNSFELYRNRGTTRLTRIARYSVHPEAPIVMKPVGSGHIVCSLTGKGIDASPIWSEYLGRSHFRSQIRVFLAQHGYKRPVPLEPMCG